MPRLGIFIPCVTTEPANAEQAYLQKSDAMDSFANGLGSVSLVV